MLTDVKPHVQNLENILRWIALVFVPLYSEFQRLFSVQWLKASARNRCLLIHDSLVVRHFQFRKVLTVLKLTLKYRLCRITCIPLPEVN